MSTFLVIDKKKHLHNPEQRLFESGYYKAYSLYLAYKNGINILDTILLTSPDSLPFLESINKYFKQTVMLRMDYSHMRKGKKLIGGIPINSVAVLKKACMFLFDNGYIPVLQTYFDRFKNKYNVNINLNKNLPHNEIIDMEVVGSGFDAGDLRLGRCKPHETISFDLEYWEISGKSTISNEEYFISKKSRNQYIGKMLAYFEYVNKTGNLLYSIEDLQPNSKNNNMNNRGYTPIRNQLVSEIAFNIYVIKHKILPDMPAFLNSGNMVASFSQLENNSIVFWDMYGSWYYR